MQPWVEKGSSSSATKSSVHYDQSLNNLHKPQQQDHRTNSSHGFRTQVQKPTHQDHEPVFSHQNKPQFENHVLDGSQVLSFLNSTDYTDHVYEDDIRPNSSSYSSYRQQTDHQSGLSKFWTEFMASDDIVTYLEQQTYIDDIYGIPSSIKQEIQAIKGNNKQKAIGRLDMIRQHFLQKAQGDKGLATQQAMTHNDWSRNFFESL